jgi:hypothetical protein
MGHILSILWEILSILWEICYLIGIFCNHSSPPPPLSTTIWKVSSENFFWQREHNLKKSGKFLSTPLIFSFPYAHEQILWFKKIIIAAWTTFQFTGNCCYLAEVYTVTYLNASKSSSGAGGGQPPPIVETSRKIVNVVGILVLKYQKKCY